MALMAVAWLALKCSMCIDSIALNCMVRLLLADLVSLLDYGAALF